MLELIELRNQLRDIPEFKELFFDLDDLLCAIRHFETSIENLKMKSLLYKKNKDFIEIITYILSLV